jgi:hypothetical protein
MRTPLEDFFYISDRKVANYMAQVPGGLANELSAEVKANLGLVSARLSTKEIERDRVAKMIVVRDFIKKHYELGTTERPATWVLDSLRVRHVHLKLNESVFLLVGKNTAGDICALVGASDHIVGSDKGQPLGTSASYFPAFAKYISEDLDALDERDASLDSFPQRFGTVLRDNEVCTILMNLHHDARGIQFNVRFLARHVFEGRCSGDSPVCKVFTPLYVSID